MRCYLLSTLLAVMCAVCHRPADVIAAAQEELPTKEVSPTTVTPEPAVVEGVNRFAWELFQQLRHGEGNLFYSPSSISAALAMAGAGASEPTQSEITRALHLTIPELLTDMPALCRSWTSAPQKGIRLKLANRLWGQAGSNYLPSFLQLTRDRYQAELAPLDFARGDEARQTINRWVAEQTENKIANLLPAGAVSADTKLVLTNAVYFRGNWTTPFDRRYTHEEEFLLPTSNRIRVPMMFSRDHFRYAAVDDLQLLQLDYGDHSLSMVVLLPARAKGLTDLEPKLTNDNVRRWLAALRPTAEAEVYLPRFKLTSQFELRAALQALGIASAFDASTADFSGITGARDLFISSVIHKSYVDVMEKGTEAAAATGVVLEPTGAPAQTRSPPVFRADRPFIFLIRDNRTGAILFVGRITNPLMESPG